MNRLQSLRAEREFCVTLNRTEAIDPASVIRTIPYAHPVYTAAGVKAQARRERDQRAQPNALLRRLLGMGIPRGRRRQRAARGRALRGAAMSASCIYEGTIRHRRFEPRREFSHRLALAYLDLEELPGSAGRADWLHGGRDWSAFVARTTWAIPRCRSTDAVRDLVSERDRGHGPRVRSGC